MILRLRAVLLLGAAACVTAAIASGCLKCGDPNTPDASAPRDSPVSGHVDAGTDAGGGIACEVVASCGSCAARFDCGWCTSSGECLQGDDIGPTDGSCSSGWTRSVSACMGACSGASSCTDCLPTAGCGFCHDTGSCVPGDEVGPSSGSCTNWAYRAVGLCVVCEDLFTCDDCTLGGVACGWCNSSSRCMPGDVEGAFDGACTSDWRFGVFDCGG